MTEWVEIWTEAPQGAMRVICQGDISIGDYVELKAVPVMVKSLEGSEGAFKFLPDGVKLSGRKGLKVEEGEYLKEKKDGN